MFFHPRFRPFFQSHALTSGVAVGPLRRPQEVHDKCWRTLKVPLKDVRQCKAPCPGVYAAFFWRNRRHGQFAICEIEVEPLPGGSGIEFVDKVVGGSVPRQFIPSVEKGVRAQLERGCLAGFPMVDLKVTLTDGKAPTLLSSLRNRPHAACPRWDRIRLYDALTATPRCSQRTAAKRTRLTGRRR